MSEELLVDNELLRCNRCGYCMSTCPTYQASLSEASVARGRLALVQALRDGNLEELPELREPFFDCLLCGACTESCFSAVKTDEVMVRARQQFHARHGQPLAQRAAFRLLRRPARLTTLMRALGLGKRSGVSRLFRRLGLLRWVSASLEHAEGLVDTLPVRFLRDRLVGMGFRPQRREGRRLLVLPRDPRARQVGPRVTYFIGCGTNFQTPRAGEAALRLLALAGCEVVVPEHWCCGLPPYSYGDLDTARELARHNLAALRAADGAYLVTDCGSCSRFLKRYAELLGPDDPEAEAARELAARARDFTELLADLPLPDPVRPLGGRVTYHDPCHLGRGQGLREAPRALLRAAVGEAYVELPEADWCCGGAGSYSLTHPELSGAILARKMENLRATQAAVLTTACPSCLLQLGWGVREADLPVRVCHVAELLAQAHGLPLDK